MMTDAGHTPHGHPRKLVGLRREPGRLALAVFRLPLHAYRHGAGWLFGRTFLAFAHVGRKSGRRHEAVAMVLRYEAARQEAVICAAWGPKTDWSLNLHAGPALEVKLGREVFAPAHRFLSDAEAFDVAARFRQEHPWRMRLLSGILGLGDLRDDSAMRRFVGTHPFVAFRPATAPPPTDDTAGSR